MRCCEENRFPSINLTHIPCSAVLTHIFLFEEIQTTSALVQFLMAFALGMIVVLAGVRRVHESEAEDDLDERKDKD